MQPAPDMHIFWPTTCICMILVWPSLIYFCVVLLLMLFSQLVGTLTPSLGCQRVNSCVCRVIHSCFLWLVLLLTVFFIDDTLCWLGCLPNAHATLLLAGVTVTDHMSGSLCFTMSFFQDQVARLANHFFLSLSSMVYTVVGARLCMFHALKLHAFLFLFWSVGGLPWCE